MALLWEAVPATNVSGGCWVILDLRPCIQIDLAGTLAFVGAPSVRATGGVFCTTVRDVEDFAGVGNHFMNIAETSGFSLGEDRQGDSSRETMQDSVEAASGTRAPHSIDDLLRMLGD